MIKNNKKKFLTLGVLATMSLFSVACGSDTSTGAGERDRLIVAQGGDAVSLDLHAANDSSSSQVTAQIFETLIRQDENMQLVPGLAKEWRQIDELTWEFDLLEGVKFHNGETLTANDVAFTLKRAVEAPQIAAIVSEIDPEGIKVIDDHTIQISTFEPFAPILAHLAHTVTGIMSEVAVTEMEAEDINVGQNPIGTGPFEFVSWNAGDQITLKRFEDFHGEAPAFNELVIRVITETSNRFIELETGAIDVALNVGPSDLPRFETNDNLTLLTGANLSTAYIGFNMNKEPFDDVRVRQAINYAVDVEAIVNHVLDGVGEVAQGPIGQNVWGAASGLRTYDFNLERAKELMAEAGLEDGFETTIWTNENTERVQIITAIQAQLREIGINARVEQMEWGAYLERTAAGEHEMFILGWGSVTGDADYGLFPLFHSSVPAAAGNRTFFANDRVDELLETARASVDQEERLALYAEVQEIVMNEAPWLFLTTGETNVGVSSHVRGLILSPAQHHRLSTIYFE